MRDAKAKNVTAVQALLKTDEISVDDDGNLNGLDSQLEAIKKDNGFLFESDQQKQGCTRIGGKLGNETEDSSPKDPIAATIDEEFHAESKIWQPLTGGAKSITVADFTGVRSVRINKFDGFADATTYIRNGDNVRYNVTLFQNSTVYAVASLKAIFYAPHSKKIVVAFFTLY